MRRAHDGEKMTTLDGVERQLTSDMLMISDTLGTVAIGGVMGGLETEVNDQTRNVLLEAASFDFISNRRTLADAAAAQRGDHTLQQGYLGRDASARGAALRPADGRAGRRRVVTGIEDCYPTAQPSAVIDITPAEVRRILGMDVPAAQISAILRRLEFDVAGTALGWTPLRRSRHRPLVPAGRGPSPPTCWRRSPASSAMTRYRPR